MACLHPNPAPRAAGRAAGALPARQQPGRRPRSARSRGPRARVRGPRRGARARRGRAGRPPAAHGAALCGVLRHRRRAAAAARVPVCAAAHTWRGRPGRPWHWAPGPGRRRRAAPGGPARRHSGERGRAAWQVGAGASLPAPWPTLSLRQGNGGGSARGGRRRRGARAASAEGPGRARARAGCGGRGRQPPGVAVLSNLFVLFVVRPGLGQRRGVAGLPFVRQRAGRQPRRRRRRRRRASQGVGRGCLRPAAASTGRRRLRRLGQQARRAGAMCCGGLRRVSALLGGDGATRAGCCRLCRLAWRDRCGR